MISTKETKLRGYTIKHTNSKEFHSVKDEIFNTDAYKVNLGETPVIVDFGAHIGLSVVNFRIEHPESKIYAFEPNPNAFNILNENIFNNGFKNIETFNTFVDLHDGTRILHEDIDGDWLSTTSYLSGSWTGSEPTRAIEVICKDARVILEDIIEKESTIDLIKMDIEGYEVKIVEHIKSLFPKIENLILEFHPSNRKSFTRTFATLRKCYQSVSLLQEGKDVKSPDLNDLFVIKCSR